MAACGREKWGKWCLTDGERASKMEKVLCIARFAMNAQERRERILSYINLKREAMFSEIRGLFPEVSEMTIRRDLEFLSQGNKIIRVLGGARSVDSLLLTSEDAYTKRSQTQAESKAVIAEKALKLLRPDSTVFLGSGTTTYQLAKRIPNGTYYIVTTCFNCAIELSSREDISLIMMGGSVNKNSYCVNGSIAAEMVENMRFNMAFLGVSGYFPGKGFATSVAEDYVLRQKIVERSDCTVIMMDSTKAAPKGMYTFAPFEAVDYVISDGKLPCAVIEELEQYEITVL